MHDIEPFYNWRDEYSVENDIKSSFYKKVYNEFEFTKTIYNYFIHPQWDEFGSPTLYLKILFTDYSLGFIIIELIGEWNDCINNDIMFFKRDLIDHLLKHKINKFILVGENVLNFHASDDCYYQEWREDIADTYGWIVALNFREHILDEMNSVNLNHYIYYGEHFNELNWRIYKPLQLFYLIEKQINGKNLRIKNK